MSWITQELVNFLPIQSISVYFSRRITVKLLVRGMLFAGVAMLTGCGGSSTTPTVGGVYILAGLTMSTSSTSPPYFASAQVSDSDNNNAPIADAIVTVNSQQLPYNTSAKDYSGAVLPDADGKFNLSVTVKGVSYTASQSSFTSLPVLTVPSPFIAASPNTITWTAPGGAPVGQVMSYNLEIFDTNLKRVHAPPGVISTSINIPSGTTVAGTPYIAKLSGGVLIGNQIANAATGSNFCLVFITQSNFSAQ